MDFRAISAGLVVLALTGCAATNWQHTTIIDKAAAEKQLAIYDGYCTLVADGSVPMPQIMAPATPRASNVTLTGSTYNTTTGQRTYGTYTGQVTTVPTGGFAGGFASGMASGASIGAAIRARLDQERIHKACMIARGWTDAPVSTTAASTSPVPTKVVAASRTTNATKIYPTQQEEWAADTDEFMQFYPAYRSGSLHEWLDGKARTIAKEQPTWPGSQILLTAHNSLAAAGQAAPEPKAEDVKAMLLFFKGAAEGKPMDQAALGTMYMKGSSSIPANLKRSAFWSQKSALAGNSIGQTGYGLLMFFGSGVPQDHVEGYRWVRRAAVIDADARKLLKDLEGQMTPDELQAVQ